MMRADLPKPDYARNMRIIAHCDQGGRPDGVQIMVHRGYAYIGHMFSKGFSVLDVRDPKRPRAVNYLPAPPGTWNIHLQTHDDLLLVINAKDMFAAAEFADESPAWPSTSRYGLHHAIVHGDTAYAAWRDAGMLVLDVADRAQPRLIAHRNWSPPFGGGTHNCLPLPDRDLLIVLDEAVLDHQEDGLKLIWVFDNRIREQVLGDGFERELVLYRAWAA